MIHKPLLLLAAVLPGTAAHAQQRDPYAYKMFVTEEEGTPDPAVERRYTPRLAACQKHVSLDVDIAWCFEYEFERQDAVLNRTWRATLVRLPAAKHRPLLIAQRKWIAERDPFCQSAADEFTGGSIVPVVYQNCRAEVTIRRTMWLERLR